MPSTEELIGRAEREVLHGKTCPTKGGGGRGNPGNEPKHYPEPKHPYCNKGHRLVEVYDERHNAYIWDCPICIKAMRRAGQNGSGEKPRWQRDAEDFIAGLKHIKYLQPDGRPLPEWKLFYGNTWEAAWDAARAAARVAWDAALNAARAAAGAAARAAAGAAARAAAEDAARAAWVAALAAAGDAIWDAAGAAAEDAALDATWDAALLARCLIVSDMIDPKHLAHARARMQVWEKGYALLCDVDGVLYVYAKEASPRSGGGNPAPRSPELADHGRTERVRWEFVMGYIKDQAAAIIGETEKALRIGFYDPAYVTEKIGRIERSVRATPARRP